MSKAIEPVPYLDLSAEFKELEAEWFDAIREAGRSGRFILGPNVGAFEQETARYLGVEHAIGVANGTDALVLVLRAAGLKRGDEIITTPWTFFASAEVIAHIGAVPIFVDIDPDTFNLNPQQVEARITSRTKAILPVHIFGCPVNLSDLGEIALHHRLEVIEDCAQAFGASWNGEKVGSAGTAGCFSFYPTKVLGGYGDGGLISTSDNQLATTIRHLCNHGAASPFIHDQVGHNSRLDEIQAALLRIKLRKLDQAIARRNQVASWYHSRFIESPVVTPSCPFEAEHAYNLYTIRTPDRDPVRAALTDAKIGSSICYPQPLHLQTVFSHLNYQAGSLPVAETAADEVISLPIFPDMAEEQVDRVCQVVLDTIGQ